MIYISHLFISNLCVPLNLKCVSCTHQIVVCYFFIQPDNLCFLVGPINPFSLTVIVDKPGFISVILFSYIFHVFFVPLFLFYFFSTLIKYFLTNILIPLMFYCIFIFLVYSRTYHIHLIRTCFLKFKTSFKIDNNLTSVTYKNVILLYRLPPHFILLLSQITSLYFVYPLT